MADDLEFPLNALGRCLGSLQNRSHAVLNASILPSEGGYQRSERNQRQIFKVSFSVQNRGKLLSVAVVVFSRSAVTFCDPMDCNLPGSSIHGIFWSGLPFLSLEDLPHPGIKPVLSAWQEDSLPLIHVGNPLI